MVGRASRPAQPAGAGFVCSVSRRATHALARRVIGSSAMWVPISMHLCWAGAQHLAGCLSRLSRRRHRVSRARTPSARFSFPAAAPPSPPPTMVHTARSARPAAPMRPVEAECPFCPFRDVLGDIVALHILQEHPEDGEAPFVLPEAANDAPNNGAFPAHNGGFPPFNPLDYADPATFLPEDLDADEAETTYMACPEDCGESVLLVDLQMHLDFHAAEQISMEDAQVGLDFEKKRQKRERSAANGYFSKPGRYLQSPESDRRKKEPKVTFIEASQQSSKGSKWMQKAALSITGAPYRTQSKAVTKSKMVHTPRLGVCSAILYFQWRASDCCIGIEPRTVRK